MDEDYLSFLNVVNHIELLSQAFDLLLLLSNLNLPPKLYFLDQSVIKRFNSPYGALSFYPALCVPL